MNSQINSLLLKRLLLSFFLFISAIILYIPANAQEQPPKPILVISTAQYLSFGIFIQNGAYGTVTVTPNGVRSATGSIILPMMSSVITPALFDVEAIPGTIITIQPIPNASLTTSNGVDPIILVIDAFSYQSPLITTGVNTEVRIGGTLIVNSLTANPAGAYSGTFSVTFIQQ